MIDRGLNMAEGVTVRSRYHITNDGRKRLGFSGPTALKEEPQEAETKLRGGVPAGQVQ